MCCVCVCVCVSAATLISRCQITPHPPDVRVDDTSAGSPVCMKVLLQYKATTIFPSQVVGAVIDIMACESNHR